MPRHVNPKNLEKRHKGTKKPKESSDESHYAPSYYTGSYYDIPTYGGGHGYFKPGAGDYLLADDDTNSTTTTYASQSMYAYYNNNSNDNIMMHREGGNDSTAYTSLHGRRIATETEDLDAPRDGHPKLPGDAGLATAYYREARSISPAEGESLSLVTYCMGFQPAPAAAAVGWGHWAGQEDAPPPPELGGTMTTTTTRWEYRDQTGADMAKKVDLHTRRVDKWADEGLDRHTASRRRNGKVQVLEERLGDMRGARRDDEKTREKRRGKKRQEGGDPYGAGSVVSARSMSIWDAG
ncbi:hypothetical protein PG987_010379 [Apiospora arundinis]